MYICNQYTGGITLLPACLTRPGIGRNTPMVCRVHWSGMHACMWCYQTSLYSAASPLVESAVAPRRKFSLVWVYLQGNAVFTSLSRRVAATTVGLASPLRQFLTIITVCSAVATGHFPSASNQALACVTVTVYAHLGNGFMHPVLG